MSKTFPNNEYLTKKEFHLEINDIKEILRTLKHSVMSMEAKMNLYSEMYEINKWNTDKLANRVNRLEKHNGIPHPQEFLVSGL